MASPTEIRPQEGPQAEWLASSADIAVYGGAAYGGKSFALLMEPLRHVANPGFGGVIFRRTCKQVTNEGGLWDTSGEIYPLAGAKPISTSLDWRFPSGANINFAHLEHEKNKYDWQGSQIPFLGFDELTHFAESQFWYLISRNRSGCGVRPYVRATTNPDAGSWVKKFLAPWVDRKFPDPAKSGEIRWLLRINGQLLWGRTRAELTAKHPDLIPKSVTFVRASIWDNKIGMARDPEYLGSLHAQSPVEMARLLHGDWDVVNEGLVYPDFGSCVVEPEDWPETLAGLRYGGIDWGFNNPFGALEAMLDGDDVLHVRWERHGSRITLTEHSKALLRGQPGHPEDSVRYFGDPAGADQIAEMRVAGHDVVPCVHLGTRPLEAGIAQVTDRIRTGRLKVLGTLGHLIEEAGKYRYEKQTEKPVDADNHLLAALRYMVVGIDRGRSIGDRAGEVSAAEIKATRLAEQEARSAEWHDPEAPHWWGEDDDS